MTGPKKRLAWALASTTPLALVILVAIFYVYGTPSFVATLLNRPVTEPTAEEYAVYSAFVDGLFSSGLPFRADQSINGTVCVMNETIPIKNPGYVPLDAAVLGPSDMGEDFFRQNTQTWPLQRRFRASLRVSLVDRATADRAASFGIEETCKPPKRRAEVELKVLPHTSPTGPFPYNTQVSGVLELSRVGFNRRTTLALLYFSYLCGDLCGESGWVVLHKTGGNWAVKEFGSGVVY
ncbi:MAG TPA: hypothetical protein VEV41_21650 [Terriglobales bacterium]|nr:hypothetical protein [Terriglobales bacterium]